MSERESRPQVTDWTARVLQDVHDGLVTVYPGDSIDVPDTVALEDRVAYRGEVVTLRARAWVMEPMPDGRPGARTLMLTTVGEYMLRMVNPRRYESATAIEHRDGRIEAVRR